MGDFGGFEILIVLAIVFFIAVPIVSIIDIVRSDFYDNNKIIWVLTVLFLGAAGALIYYFIGTKQKV